MPSEVQPPSDIPNIAVQFCYSLGRWWTFGMEILDWGRRMKAPPNSYIDGERFWWAEGKEKEYCEAKVSWSHASMDAGYRLLAAARQWAKPCPALEQLLPIIATDGLTDTNAEDVGVLTVRAKQESELLAHEARIQAATAIATTDSLPGLSEQQLRKIAEASADFAAALSTLREAHDAIDRTDRRFGGNLDGFERDELHQYIDAQQNQAALCLKRLERGESFVLAGAHLLGLDVAAIGELARHGPDSPGVADAALSVAQSVADKTLAMAEAAKLRAMGEGGASSGWGKSASPMVHNGAVAHGPPEGQAPPPTDGEVDVVAVAQFWLVLAAEYPFIELSGVSSP